MKICPKCNTGNKDNAISCKECGTAINNIEILDDDQVFKDFIRREEQKQFRKRVIEAVSMVIIGLVYLVLYIKALSSGEFLLVTFIAVIFPVIGYLNIFHPKVLFTLRHIFTIENIEEVELTDLYLICSRISGVFMLVMGLVILFVATGIIK